MASTIKSSIIFLWIFFLSNYGLAQDWANLKRFETANAELKPPLENENRVVFMGNSITEGWLNDSLTFFDNASYINRGIGGQTTPQMLLRFRADVVDLNPAVVVILAGINDIAENTGPSTLKMIVDNIVSMCEIANANNIKVVLSSVLPAYDFFWNPNTHPAERVMELNTLLKAYADKNKIVYLDYFSAMADHRNGLNKAYTNDEVHPTIAGYKVMEPMVEAAIARALKH